VDYQEENNFPGELAALSILVLMVLVFFSEMIFTSKIPLFRDLGPSTYPMMLSLAQSLERGELPLWEPRLAMGFPLLANFQSGAFYLPNLVYLAFPFSTAIKASFILHTLIAALGAYFLARYWGFLRPIALIGSLLFAFGGFTVSLLNLPTHFQAAVWLPWLLLFGEKQVVSGDRWRLLVLALVATLQFLAGSPEIYAMSMALLLFDSFRMKWEGKTSYRKVFSSLLVVYILVVGLSMVQILPTLELLLEASRYQVPSFQLTTQWSFQPVDLLNLFFLDKEIDVTSFDRFQSFFSDPTPLIMSLYMGVLFPFGLWSWILTEKGTRKAVFLACIGLFLLLSMGSYTPLYRFFYNFFPLVSLTRFPQKFFFLAFVLLIYVTLRGVANLFAQLQHGKSTKLLLGPAALCGVFAVAYLLFRSSSEILLHLSGWLKGSFPDLRSAQQIISGVLLHLERQVALLVGVGTLFFLWQKEKIGKTTLELLIVGIVFADLYSAHRPYQFQTDQSILSRKPPPLEVLKDPSFYRLFFISPQSPIHPFVVLFPKAKSPADYSLFSFPTLHPNTGLFWGIQYLQDMDSLKRASYAEFVITAGKLPASNLYNLLGVLNVKYLVSLQELPPGDIIQIGYFPEYPLWVYRIEGATQRAYVVPTAIYEKEPKKVIDQLANRGFDPSRQVILDESIQLKATKDFIGEAKILTYANTKIGLDVSLNRPGILVLSDSFYPGWKVYVDGVEGKVMRANYFYRGVLLSPGEHQVVFRYRPTSFLYGTIISLSTAGLLLAYFIIRRRRIL